MPRRGVNLRPVWEDQYTLPKRADLLSAIPRPHRGLVDTVRERLLKLPSVEETLSWRGIPWRWTFGYSLEGEGDRPFAFLVPSPVRPIFAMPFNAAQCRNLRASRAVMDGLVQATRVGVVLWPQWDLSGRPLVEELLTVAQKRCEILLAHA